MTAPLEVAPAIGFSLTSAEWEARVARLRSQAAEDEIDSDEVAEALASFRFRDEAGVIWSHDGVRWAIVEGASAANAAPSGRLVPLPYVLEPVAEPVPLPDGVPEDDQDEPDGGQPAPPYRATHVVPVSGLPTWPQPDPSLPPHNQLDPGLDVMVLEWRPDGWAHIATSNTWTAWIDGRLLDPIPPDRPTAA